MTENAALVRPVRDASGGNEGMLDFCDEIDLAGSGAGTGSLRSWHCDSVGVTVADAEFRVARRQRLEMLSDVLLVRAACDGDCRYTVDGGATWRWRGAAVTVAALPRGTLLDIDFAAGVRERSLSVWMHPRALADSMGQTDLEVPEPLRRLGEAPLVAASHLLSMPIGPDIQSLLYDLRHSRLQGKLRSLQMGTRAAELLVLMSAEWSTRLQETMGAGMLQRDADLLATARHVLSERCTAPPTLMELARELGTNKNKLNRLFRDRFDTTPQGFALERRMERAQSLIAGGRMTFGQVADAVGYQHQSSFTTAFRQAMGVSPREYASRVEPATTH